MYELTVTNMATIRTFVAIYDKFTVERICSYLIYIFFLKRNHDCDDDDDDDNL
jgi:hypothetical protein